MNRPGLDPLLERPDVWRGPRIEPAQPTLASGHAALDALLPGGGWPLGVLTELCCAQPGMGELSLLLPALVRLRREARWLAWVAPPYPLHVPALADAGIDLTRCLVVEPPQPGLRHATARAQQALWAAEQLLRGGACGAVLLWWDGEDANAMRRLQLAAERAQALAVLFRPVAAATRLSPAALRLRIDGDDSFEIVKCRGGDWRAERGRKLRLLAGQPYWRTRTVDTADVPPVAAPRRAPFAAAPERRGLIAAAKDREPDVAATPVASASPAAGHAMDWRAQARYERLRRS